MKKNLNEAIEKISYLEAVFNGGPGSGNFAHAGRKGKVGGSTKKGESVSEPTDLKVVIDGKEMSPSEAKEYLENNKDLEVLDRINSKLGDLKELEKSVLLDKGWVPVEEDGKICGEFNDKINRHKFALGKDDERVMNNGKRYLEDNNDEYYVSKPSNIDGVAIYTTTDKEDALIYADGDESRICRLVVDKSNFISQEKLDEIRKRLSNKADNYKLKYALRKVEGSKHSYCPVKDTILASMYGYDGIIRLGANEYIVMNPERLSLDKTNLSKRMNELISKINGLGCYNKNKEIKKMKLTREQYNFVKQKLEELEKEINGGKGSGNFGHSGRPGLVGGSGKGSSSKSKIAKALKKRGIRAVSDKTLGDSAKTATNLSVEEEAKKLGIVAGETADGRKFINHDSKVGIPGDMDPSDVKTVPRLAKDGDSKKVEDEFAELWEKPEKRKKALKDISKYVKNGKVETDAIKQLDERWGDDDKFEDISERITKGGEVSDDERKYYDEHSEFRQKYNTVLHQTANVLAKQYFKDMVTNDADLANITVLATSGGCASGKGYGIKKPNVVEGVVDGKTFQESLGTAKYTWDAAGEQNSSELGWVSRLGQKNTVIVHTVGDMINNCGGNLIKRSVTNGRTVDANIVVDSYIKGNSNANKFYKKHNGSSGIRMYKVENDGKSNPKFVEFGNESDFEKSANVRNGRSAVNAAKSTLDNPSATFKEKPYVAREIERHRDSIEYGAFYTEKK